MKANVDALLSVYSKHGVFDLSDQDHPKWNGIELWTSIWSSGKKPYRRVKLRTPAFLGIKDKRAYLPGSWFTYARLVCWVIHGRPRKGFVADHIDRNTMNDSPANLRWLCPIENLTRKDAFRKRYSPILPLCRKPRR